MIKQCKIKSVALLALDSNHIMTLTQVRVKEGRGLLHPDIFAEDRLLFLPPATGVLLVLFNRNHNVCPSIIMLLRLI